MKRICLLLLALCLMLCACGKEQTENPTTAPTEIQTVTVTEPTATQPQPVVVTKHPTDEYLEYNWKCWFVAHADNATSVTWEFLSPDGKLHSVDETVQMNPNLFLDVSKGDTVALERAPLSLNGWSVQARFEGPGGSATTDPAKITVKQSLGAYDAVLQKYEKAANARAEGYTLLAEYDVSEMIFYADSVAYALVNLDGVGVEELIIAGMGYDVPEEPVVYEIYTIQNDTAVSIASSTTGSRLFLMKDDKILCEGSTGEGKSYFSVMRVSGGELKFQDGLYTTDPTTYYYTTGNQFGDPALMATDNNMDEKVALTFLDTWRGSVYLPPLCYIA